MSNILCNTTQNTSNNSSVEVIFEIHVIEKVKISSKKDQSLKQKRSVACVRLLRAPCDVQEEDKDLDDINVEGKGSEDVFLRADGIRSVSNEQLSVVGQKLTRQAISKYSLV